ncbi:uncharacterized protein LOC114299242 [Camellia sinensis]|uniref:uncharacterized protein LOC114299242 n=1 Tax=Camellia sinensis TaxID=4442 RepID=UPI0010356B07|nr:uncharacterized protein LOC114299242 [Camellia sinensis]
MDCSFFFKLLCFFLLLVGMSAAVVADDRRTYIIHVDKSAMPSPFPDHHSWYMSTLSSLSSPNGVLPTHLYTYNHVLDGFSAVLLNPSSPCVAVTQILWRPRGLLVDQFDSKEDLINAVFTSSFIPGYLAPRPATMFSNRLCIDGGLTLFMPPTSATQTIRVCAFPASRLGLQGIGISPDCNPESRATPREVVAKKLLQCCNGWEDQGGK